MHVLPRTPRRNLNQEGRFGLVVSALRVATNESDGAFADEISEDRSSEGDGSEHCSDQESEESEGDGAV